MINNNKVTIVFPMAGDGTRFGSGYKPFNRIAEECFIEAAVRPFLKWNNVIKKYIFIIRKDHDEKFKVTSKLKEIFHTIDFEIIVLDRSTSGPVETLSSAMSSYNIEDPVIICDCDHSIKVDPMFKDILSSNNKFDAFLPIWDINKNEVSSWSIVTLDRHMNIVDINEKIMPKEPSFMHFGIIGCYFFSNLKNIFIKYNDPNIKNFSEILKKMIRDNGRIKLCRISHAEFFGDPLRLTQSINLRKKYEDA